VGAGHAHPLYLPGTSPLHRARPQCKIAASVAFVLAVVATPREAFWAFGVYALALAGLAAVGRVPLAFLARRLVIELPFLAFAVFLPVVGQGERVEVLGVPLAVGGLWAAWNIVAKGTLGVAASAIVAATTPVAELLGGLERLRLPRALTTIAGFMIRYADVIADEVRRMRIARISRGHDPRWIWQARAVASSAGTLFIRSYERGERVYLAMVSRGYAGSMPDLQELAATRAEWLAAMSVPATAALVAATAWGLRP
jgi:cobalt/nickel transport system permease protein